LLTQVLPYLISEPIEERLVDAQFLRQTLDQRFGWWGVSVALSHQVGHIHPDRGRKMPDKPYKPPYAFSVTIGENCARKMKSFYDLAGALKMDVTQLMRECNGHASPSKALVKGLWQQSWASTNPSSIGSLMTQTSNGQRLVAVVRRYRYLRVLCGLALLSLVPRAI
jgi:hypothetical protein